MDRYTTREEAIERAIVPALGDFADDYDLDAILEATFEYRTDTDAAGNEVVTYAGFEQVVTDEEFWAAVQRADITGAAGDQVDAG